MRLTLERESCLRDAYLAESKRELSERLTRLEESTGIPRWRWAHWAEQIGLRVYVRRPWTPAEVNYLRDHAGEMTVSQMRAILGRSYNAVMCKLSDIGVSGRLSAGYTAKDIAGAFGVHSATARKWIERGFMPEHGGRIAEHHVATFLRERPELYSLKRVDEAWFKGLLFGDAECYSVLPRAVKSEVA